MGDLLLSNDEISSWELRPRSVDQMGFVVSKMSNQALSPACDDTRVQTPQGYMHAGSFSHLNKHHS